MLQKRLLWLFVALAVSGCKEGPRVTVCVLSNESAGLECADADGTAFYLPFHDAESFVCMSPDDTKAFLKWCEAGQ
jgi:hypothetical protein